MSLTVRTVRSFEEWRQAARPLLAARVSPAAIEWGDAHTLRTAAGAAAVEAPMDPKASRMTGAAAPRISAGLLSLLQALAVYREAGRWELMYRLVWRSVNENAKLLEDAADPDVHRASLMEREIRRDEHKMHAFVRFREQTGSDDQKSYFAWFEPAHEILRRAAVFFVQRFVNMHWTIATPDGAACWDGAHLAFIESPALAERPRHDDAEGLWRTYYRSICNAARINPAAMQREMPQRYWRHLPEAPEIQTLLRDGATRLWNEQRESNEEEIRMPKAVKRALPAQEPAGESPQTCRRCDLWQQATQAVMGEGRKRAPLMLVGEQPGDEEDLRGHPFVGPAGRVLDEAIEGAGLDRADLFVTNAVKHFKWEPRGKRRLHKKPGIGEINACNLWLIQELESQRPAVIVALGATALRALTGKTWSIDGARREELHHASGARIMATYHPSAILRAEGARSAELRRHLVEDLQAAGKLVEGRV